MASPRAKFTVGLFMAGGTAIALLALVWLGMSRFLEQGRRFVTYFNESVQGLDVDSPVKYRGVPIGRVERIDVAPDSRLVQVVMAIRAEHQVGEDAIAQLKVVGITGSMFIEMDRLRPGDLDRSPGLSFPTDYPVIPSKPSDIRQLLSGIDEALQQIQALDLPGLSASLKETLAGLNATMAAADVASISGDLRRVLASLGTALDPERLDRLVASLEGLLAEARGAAAGIGSTAQRAGTLITREEPALRAVLDELTTTLAGTRELVARGSGLLDSTDRRLSTLERQIVSTGRRLDQAAANLDRLLDTVQDRPSRLLFDHPPAPREQERPRLSPGKESAP
ncbi:MAG: MlaD family protein [Thermodesulfobacteriota bacterium]